MISLESQPLKFSPVEDNIVTSSIDPTERNAVQCNECQMMLRRSLTEAHQCIHESEKFSGISFKKGRNNMFVCPMCNRQLYKLQIETHLKTHPHELIEKIIEMQMPKLPKATAPSAPPPFVSTGDATGVTGKSMIVGKFLETYRKKEQESKQTEEEKKKDVSATSASVRGSSSYMPASRDPVVASSQLRSPQTVTVVPREQPKYPTQPVGTSSPVGTQAATMVSREQPRYQTQPIGTSPPVGTNVAGAQLHPTIVRSSPISPAQERTTSLSSKSSPQTPMSQSVSDTLLAQALSYSSPNSQREPPKPSPSPQVATFTPQKSQPVVTPPQSVGIPQKPQSATVTPQPRPSPVQTPPQPIPVVRPAPVVSSPVVSAALSAIEVPKPKKLALSKADGESIIIPRKRSREFTVKECIRKIRKTEFGFARLEENSRRCKALVMRRFFRKLKQLTRL
mmetsp:Transcript_17429/g.31463  ORF Transcript_17429/g.31463 Transcript_17429/m.31463 type:complete len:451 (+) Transcript_17429:9075-10427(+)